MSAGRQLQAACTAGRVRLATRLLLALAAGLALALVAVVVPARESRPAAAVDDPLAQSSPSSPAMPVDFTRYFSGSLRDPFSYRQAAGRAPAPAPAATAPATVAADPPIDGTGLELLAVLGGPEPAACLRDRDRTRTVGLGDAVRGATVAAIAAEGVVLGRGARTHTIAPRAATRPLASLPFGGGGDAPTLRLVQPSVLGLATAHAAVPTRRRLGLAVRDERGGVAVAGTTRSDLDVLPGDRLLEIDGTAVTSSADAARLLSLRVQAASIALLLQRDGRRFLVSASWKEEP